MSKWIFRFIVLVFLLILLVGVWLSLWGGLVQYSKTLITVYKLPPPLRNEALLLLNDDTQGIQGILARVNIGEKGGVWIWRNFWLQYFPKGSDTVYSYWHACDNLYILELKEGETRSINREIDVDITAWASRVKSGQSVTLQLSDEFGKKTIREIQAYDWWVYLPVSLEKQCAR